MSLKSKYSPPYSLDVLGEVVLVFKRMLTAEWEGFAEELKADKVRAADAQINEQAGKESPQERQMMRIRARDYFDQEVTLGRVIRDSSATVKDIRRLLAFSLIDKSQAEWLEVISPLEVTEIINQIVYLPVVKPENPQPLPRPDEARDGGSDATTSNLSGPDSPPTSTPPSPAETPAN